MTDRRAFVKILAGVALLGIARRAGAQKAKPFTITYLALRIATSCHIFYAVSSNLVTSKERICSSSIGPRKVGQNFCQALRLTSLG